MAMERQMTFAGTVAAIALLLLPNVAVAQSIELVEARAMTVGGSSTATQRDNSAGSTAERSSSTGGQSAASQSGTSTTERRSLRDAARREGYSASHRRSGARDDVRIGKSDATRSARWQSDVAEHRQQRRGAAQGGPANAGGNGKGPNAG